MNGPKPWLQDPKATAEVLKKYSFRFQKKFGQNFLIDSHVLDKIITAADIKDDDMILEIGPGIGTLTQLLAYNARKVVSVEIDNNLIPILEYTLKDYDNVRIINEDILKLDIAKLVREENNNGPIKVVANLPYYITTPIIMGLFEKHVPIESITVMIQKEVADRMSAGPGTKNYGALSLAVQYYSEPYLAANVPPNCFMPRPDVSSAVIRLTLVKDKVRVSNEETLFKLIKAAFAQRRKTFMNCLKNSDSFDLSKDEWETVFYKAGLPLNIRGETLTLEEFVQLTDLIENR